jgi:hypothetical protein
MKTMAVRRVDRLFIVVYGATNPTDDDFGRFLESLNRFGVDGSMHLVVTEGGEPSQEHRARLRALIRGRFVPVAVLSSSRRQRAMVNMQAWFRIPTKAFKMSEVHAALDYLRIPPQRYEHIKTELRLAFRELG